MSPELTAVSIVLWAWFIGLTLSPYFEKQLGPESRLGRLFAGLSRVLERSWNAAMRRG